MASAPGNIANTVSQVLSVLSQKFGTTGQYLWLAILKQQYIYGVFALLMSIIAFITGIVLIFAGRHWHKKLSTKDEDNYNRWDKDDDFWFWTFITIGVVICFAVFTGFLYPAITHLANPTYSAVEDIMNSGPNSN
jgi:heme/copper-type cytochrome/quinol oxidase subunit 2